MAVIRVWQMSASCNAQHQYTKRFGILTNNRADSILSVRGDRRLPQDGQYYQEAGGMDMLAHLVWPPRIEYRETARRGIVFDGYYDFKPWELHPPEPKEDQNPLNQAPDVTYSSYTIEQYDFLDAKKKPYQNSAGHFYDGVGRPLVVDVVSYTCNVAEYSRTAYAAYKGKCNAGRFAGSAPYTWFMKDIHGQTVTDDRLKVQYGQVTFELHYRGDDWKTRLLDLGPYYLKADINGTIGKYFEKTGDQNFFRGLCLLDGKGGLLPLKKVLAGDVQKRTFESFFTADFGPLHIDESYLK